MPSGHPRSRRAGSRPTAPAWRARAPRRPAATSEGERRLYRAVGGSLAVPARPARRAGGSGPGSIDAEVARASGTGHDQVVLVGAGYDGRALRFGGGAVRWFEVDLPAVQADKRQRLRALGIEPARRDRTWGSTSRSDDLGGGARRRRARSGRAVAVRLRGRGRPPHAWRRRRRCAGPCAPVRRAGSVLVAGFAVAPEPGAPRTGCCARPRRARSSASPGSPGATSSAPGTPRS